MKTAYKLLVPFFLVAFVCLGPLAMFSAYKAMNEKIEKMTILGYECIMGKESSGPAHARDVMYLCKKENGVEVTVGIWGKPVRVPYKLITSEANEAGE